ncbi:hypothetical protein HOL34_03305 [bacterium]|nr:hypothetical protein [bacterium]MBT3903843.1 hypothetical protein [bacterium]MBT4577719.1 hypothetical protein [bacterium]MBT5345613.1 hypothetical protein [bacterium]MBT6130700.1 hypothetical protein [bacterium]
METIFKQKDILYADLEQHTKQLNNDYPHWHVRNDPLALMVSWCTGSIQTKIGKIIRCSPGHDNVLQTYSPRLKTHALHGIAGQATDKQNSIT